MKVLFIGGPLPSNGLDDIEQNKKGEIWFSPDIHQKKLISGLTTKNLDYHVFSAPLIGAYPTKYKRCIYFAPKSIDSNITYVSFLNLWGIRNFSRSIRLKRSIKEYLNNIDDELLVISYMAHRPFLEASCYVKKKKPSAKICFIVPDLPEYMNLNKTTIVYRFAKWIDNRKISRLVQKVNSFVLLTEQMKERINIGTRKYTISEGLIDLKKQEKCRNYVHDTINIVYTGTLQERYGFKKLVEDFMKDPHDNYRLIVCGGGESEHYIQNMSNIDKRIIFLGQVRPEQIHAVYEKADILINPRENDSIYTKYSFPSKIIDYLMTGKPVVACMLDGMPKCYRNFIYEVIDGKYMSAVNEAINANDNNMKYNEFIKYAIENLSPEKVLDRIIDITI